MGRSLVESPYRIPVRSGLIVGLLFDIYQQLIDRLPDDFHKLETAEGPIIIFTSILLFRRSRTSYRSKQAIKFASGAVIALLLPVFSPDIQKLHQKLGSLDFKESGIQTANRQNTDRPLLTYQQGKPVLILKN